MNLSIHLEQQQAIPQFINSFDSRKSLEKISKILKKLEKENFSKEIKPQIIKHFSFYKQNLENKKLSSSSLLMASLILRLNLLVLKKLHFSDFLTLNRYLYDPILIETLHLLIKDQPLPLQPQWGDLFAKYLTLPLPNEPFDIENFFKGLQLSLNLLPNEDEKIHLYEGIKPFQQDYPFVFEKLIPAIIEKIFKNHPYLYSRSSQKDFLCLIARIDAQDLFTLIHKNQPSFIQLKRDYSVTLATLVNEENLGNLKDFFSKYLSKINQTFELTVLANLVVEFKKKLAVKLLRQEGNCIHLVKIIQKGTLHTFRAEQNVKLFIKQNPLPISISEWNLEQDVKNFQEIFLDKESSFLLNILDSQRVIYQGITFSESFYLTALLMRHYENFSEILKNGECYLKDLTLILNKFSKGFLQAFLLEPCTGYPILFAKHLVSFYLITTDYADPNQIPHFLKEGIIHLFRFRLSDEKHFYSAVGALQAAFLNGYLRGEKYEDVNFELIPGFALLTKFRDCCEIFKQPVHPYWIQSYAYLVRHFAEEMIPLIFLLKDQLIFAFNKVMQSSLCPDEKKHFWQMLEKMEGYEANFNLISFLNDHLHLIDKQAYEGIASLLEKHLDKPNAIQLFSQLIMRIRFADYAINNPFLELIESIFEKLVKKLGQMSNNYDCQTSQRYVMKYKFHAGFDFLGINQIPLDLLKGIFGIIHFYSHPLACDLFSRKMLNMEFKYYPLDFAKIAFAAAVVDDQFESLEQQQLLNLQNFFLGILNAISLNPEMKMPQVIFPAFQAFKAFFTKNMELCSHLSENIFDPSNWVKLTDIQCRLLNCLNLNNQAQVLVSIIATYENLAFHSKAYWLKDLVEFYRNWFNEIHSSPFTDVEKTDPKKNFKKQYKF